MKSWLWAKVPKLIRVETVSDADVADVAAYSWWHTILVSLDATAGILGAKIDFITISSRTALACLKAQEEGAMPAVWALILGAALETKWALPFISYAGHLQGAMVANYARAVHVQQIINGKA